MKTSKTNLGSSYLLQKRTILIIIIVSISVFISYLFAREIPSRIANGSRGHVAIRTLDEVRRPFLNIHSAESSLLRDGHSKTIHESFENGINSGLRLIAEFKTVSVYNPELLERVEKLANTFEKWIKSERTLFDHLAKNNLSNINLMSNVESKNIIASSSVYFSLTMDTLGDAEIPIHNDIQKGSLAVTEMIIVGGILLASLIGLVFFLQWFKNKKLREMFIINKQTEERLRMAMSAAEMGTWKWDTVTNQDTRDANFNRILGLEAAESTQPMEDFVERVHPEDRAAVDQEIKRSIRERDIYLAEFRIVRPDGTEQWLRDQGLPFYDKQDKISYMTGAVVDITKRKKAEEELRRISLTASASVSGIAMADTQGIITYVNDSFVKAWGYDSSEEVVGLHINKLAHEHKETSAAVNELQMDSRSIREMIGVKKDGSLFDIEIHSSIVLDNEGNPELVVSSFFDITERKRAEEDATRFNRVLEHSLNEIYIFDAETLHFIEVNRGARVNLGYSIEELRGLTPLDMKPEFTAEQFSELVAPLRNGEREIVQFSTVHRRKDGTLYPVDVYLQLMSEGIPVFVAIILDITERKRMQEEVTKSQKLESIGILAGGIAHDFNNHLQGIISTITLAKSYANPKDEIYKYLIQAEKTVHHSKELSYQLLTFSKGGEPIKKTISVSELIVNSTKLALSGSNIRCELDIPEDIWQIEADSGQFRQVISNLIINADQAMPEGGNIKVWAENIDVVEKDSLPLHEGRYVKLTIKDQGTGISQEHLQKIFDPYFTTKARGSGLGLAITFSIVKKHGGHISVESELGVGTAFYIYLPASTKKVLKESDKSKTEDVSSELVEGKDVEKATPLKGGKILFMEDDAIIRLSVTRQLRNLKYEIEEARDGIEAIELYNKAVGTGKPFSAVVMDLTIVGGMGGEETFKELFKIDPDVIAIVASGYSNDPIMTNFGEYGFKGVLEKPYEIDELDEILQKAITG